MKQAIKRRLTGLVLSAILLAALALPAFAADIPAAPSGHAVLDQAGVLSQETINTVDGYNNALASTGAEIGVLTVDFTGNLSIDDYALQVFNEWGIEGAVDYWLDIYNNYGYIEDYFLSGSQEVVFENDMNTDLPCVAFAFAVYSWGEPTGSYAVSRSFYPGEPR